MIVNHMYTPLYHIISILHPYYIQAISILYPFTLSQTNPWKHVPFLQLKISARIGTDRSPGECWKVPLGSTGAWGGWAGNVGGFFKKQPLQTVVPPSGVSLLICKPCVSDVSTINHSYWNYKPTLVNELRHHPVVIQQKNMGTPRLDAPDYWGLEVVEHQISGYFT